MKRRVLLRGTGLALLGLGASRAAIVAGELPWSPDAASPPQPVRAGPWRFFTAAEGAAVEALADRIIPPDSDTPGGRDAGCAVFIDRQLAGPYGRNEGLYDRPPFLEGTPTQGIQTSFTPAQAYRTALSGLEEHARSIGASAWAGLTAERQDAVLGALESGSLALPGVDGQAFFAALIKDVKEGFFADPLYGGNRDMCGWKMIGYPGARYDYRDWVSRHNERYPHPPSSIMGRPAWTPKA